jgi:methylenetetrahydrofolate dehydrogenase (NADP+)/methenyltetrahydrofolate cyclohydrolase
MRPVILDGKKRAKQIGSALKRKLKLLSQSVGSSPSLTALQVGDDKASCIYLESQKRHAERLGIRYNIYRFKNRVSEKKLIRQIARLNADNNTNAMIVQMPLPKSVDKERVYSAISPDKDAEGLNPQNLGKLFLNKTSVVPPTASAVMELIKMTKADLYGKEALIIGHSDIVGKPLSILLLNKFATVRVSHIATSKRGNLKHHIREAELLVAAAGIPALIKGSWLKKGSIVIDVGINNLKGRIVGDVEFEAAKKRASYITPVPGGVGPLTTAMLMRNCIELFKIQKGL